MVERPSSQDIHIFERKARERFYRRSKTQFEDYDFLFRWSEAQLLDRLQDIKRDFPRVVQLGTSGSAEFAQKLKEAAKAETLYRSDAFLSKADFICEEEALALAPQSCDLILSNLNLHAVNDLPGALVQIRRALKPDGLFLAALPGGETLYELRDCLMRAELALKGGVSPRVLPFADKQQMGGLLQRAGFALPVVDSDIVRVSYEHMFKLMADLRGMGESNIASARSRLNPGRDFFAGAAQMYAETYGEGGGRITASFEIIFLIGWAPHESQQKPLKPGSAQMRLADALGENKKS
ncbi:MAG: methyltransferase domain-containing protein [Alphaproteobacteria bacterium]|nr:methyltransferase domain-containing protein [Alphaproteobacteria bacterium]